MLEAYVRPSDRKQHGDGGVDVVQAVDGFVHRQHDPAHVALQQFASAELRQRLERLQAVEET